ncbi:MAG: hypothetical protein A2046_09385 [Bacteroidetes bacterium GWA2_30_7]|nr:MAG: hypothetical protein A2046_09385 [Bacteroidetes bacterium GWA2_30_7]
MSRIFTLILILSFSNLFSQNDTNNLIKYTTEFRFKEGIFISFEQVKSNSPVSKSKIQFISESDDVDYYTKLFNQKKISYSENDKIIDVPSEKVWGFSKNGTLYIQMNDELFRIPYVGTISHFIANVTLYRDRFQDPFMYDPYFSAFPQPTYTSKETRQFLLDFSSGQILEYNMQNVSAILMRDNELFDEYNLLKKRKKRQLMFLYIRRFNERNPLYFPQK